jgi:hypothetical protein
MQLIHTLCSQNVAVMNVDGNVTDFYSTKTIPNFKCDVSWDVVL